MDVDVIYNQDCLDGMKMLPDKSIDLVIIDPPYEFSTIGGGSMARSKTYHSELNALNTGVSDLVFDELVRVMRKINIYIWCNKAQIQQHINYFVNLGCNFDLLTWHKTNPIPKCNNNYLPDTEHLLHFREDGVPIYGEYATKKKYYVSPTNKADKDKWGHPTIKPLNIIENLIVNSSSEGDIVLDCFLGSGTTAVAAVNTNRHYIGFELDSKYYDIACRRLDEAEEVTSA